MECYGFFFVMFLALHGCLEFSAGTCVSKWSYWVNRDNQTTGDGDRESMSTKELSSFCGDGRITHIECETVQGTPSYRSGEIVSCTVAGGLVCLKADNLPLYCSDYTVRYFCDCQVPVTNVQLLKNGLLMDNNVMTVDVGVPITLSCHVSPGTSRPPPTIIWYIGPVVKQQSTSTTYTFTPSDTDHGKGIFCKAYNVQPASQAVESAKLVLYVRVPVTYAQLERDGRIINSSLLDVFYGAAVELTCNVSPSRPAPAIAWYIGSVLKQESTSTTFTFTVSYSDQYKTIFCKAYNLKLQSQAVESSKPMLNVKGQSTSPSVAITTPNTCKDWYPNCTTLGSFLCTANYKPWSEINCRKFCGFCGTRQSTSPSVAITTPNTCKDEYSDCTLLGSFYCTANYEVWSEINCRKFCGFCGTTITTPSSTLSTSLKTTRPSNSNTPQHGGCEDKPGFPCSSIAGFCSDAYIADKYCQNTCGRCHGPDGIAIG